MQYFITFLEGIITFISPCLLPMLPIYVSYFAGGKEKTIKKTLVNSLGFVLGFTILFSLMGLLAGSLGSFFTTYQKYVNIICGLIIIFFGLNYLEVFKFNLFNGSKRKVNTDNMGFLSAFVFGIVFSIGWTPCVGAFLGSALLFASSQGHAVKGVFLLLSYSLGLALPFILSSLLIESLKEAFMWIKKHYKVINISCGCFLIIIGILMASGTIEILLGLLS